MKAFWTKIPLIPIVATILVVVVWAWLWFLVSRTLTQVVVAETEVASLARRQENVAQLKKVLLDTTIEREQVANLFITAEKIVSLIETLEGWARELGANLTIDQAEMGAEQLTLSLTATGSFGAVSRLLNFIEHLPYLIKLESVSLKQDESTTTGNNWLLRLNILIASFDNV
ncbi:MAG: hypothetical protein HYV76_01900 [Candidatus Vogelbacteria bacterium]|nr:hypothetical protein [Candidatus Vogelbacteria bacterium]